MSVSLGWVSEYDPAPIQPHKRHEKKKFSDRENFFGFNVLGFKPKNRLKMELKSKVIERISKISFREG